jgi:SAM-dependent methyltransferase
VRAPDVWRRKILRPRPSSGSQRGSDLTCAHFLLTAGRHRLFDEVRAAIANVYSTVRRRIAALLREYRWLAPAATVLSAIALAVAVGLHLRAALTGGASAALLAMAYLWGYSTRAFRRPPWPSLEHLHRRQYAETWDALANSRRSASIAVSGKGWEDELRTSAAEPVRNLIELASISEQDDVLEIGCGIGRIGRELASRCRSWTGADISPNMLAYAAERLSDLGNVRLVQLHETGLSELTDASFDVAYSTGVFDHLDEMDRWRYIEEAFRVLRRGGRIFVDNMNLASDDGWAAFVEGARQAQKLERPPYLPRFSTAAELTTYAARAGFVNAQAHHKGPLVIVAAVKPRVNAAPE